MADVDPGETPLDQAVAADVDDAAAAMLETPVPRDETVFSLGENGAPVSSTQAITAGHKAMQDLEKK